MKEHLIEFNQLAMANAEGSDEMLNRVMTKDNIGLAALLETKEGVFESSGGMIWAATRENQHCGFWPGRTQIELYKHRRRLKAGNFGFRK